MTHTPQRILVTGGTSGIGRELVELYSKRGDTVYTCGRNAERLSTLIAETGVDGAVVDLAEPGAASSLVRAAVESMGALDLVIANAGVQAAHDFLKPPTEDALNALVGEVAVNLTAPALLAAAAIPELAHTSGSFAAVTSGLAYAPKKTAPLYCGTKSGLRTFLDALRYQAEDSNTDVSVHEVVLPVVATEMTAGRNDGEMSARAAAERIAAGLDRRRDRVVVGKARLLLPVMRVAPGLGRRILRNS